MVYCFAFGCKNGEHSGKSTFKFPPDTPGKKKLRKLWIEACNRKPSDTKSAKRPRLCQDHFRPDSFNKHPEVAKSIGCRLDLKHGAVPDPLLFDRGHLVTMERKSMAFQKRQNISLIHEMEKNQEESNELLMDDDNISTSSQTAGTTITYKDCSVQCSLQVDMANKSTWTPRKYLGSKTKGTQCNFATVQTATKLCQCDIIMEPPPCHDYNDDSEYCEYIPHNERDETWEPGNMEEEDEDLSDDETFEDDEELEDIKEELRSDKTPERERKFLVFESCLMAILTMCSICNTRCKVVLQYVKGTFAAIEQTCERKHRRVWFTQPLHGTMPQGNLQLAAGILFSGSSPVKVINMFKHVNILSIAYRTYNMIQAHYLLPAVFHVWKAEQDALFDHIRCSGEKVVLGGDGRCDSPGHTAKYGSYTMMEITYNKVIDLQLVQSNEVTSSSAMELEGLKRSFNVLDNNNIKVSSLTTDRHPSIQKYMRERRPLIQHFYDVWHMAKSIYKKILLIAKKKGFEALKDWAHSISNHLYWCASSSNGDAEMVKAKWKSITNHVVNIHTGHGDKYPSCLHGNLEDRDWLSKGTRIHKKLELLVENKRFVKDIGKLSPAEQTSAVEAYHSVLCYFAPKSVHYFYAAMKARLLLACLHFNENSDRAQARTQAGELVWSVSYPKYKEGGIIKGVKIDYTFEYIKILNSHVQNLRKLYPSYRQAKALINQYIDVVPPSLSSRVENEQTKAEMIQNYRTRFPNKTK